jgi:3',5'-cyclic AMP phosphodiesterase CpdA
MPLAASAQELRLPNKPGSVKFAIIGDSGQPGSGQTAIAKQMGVWRSRFPFEFILMTGDNLYGSERPRDYEKKFSIPYKALIDGGVKFYASLGNHDDSEQIQYKLFNMDGKKYYSFKPKAGVRFFAVDSNYVDDKQLQWLDKELAASGSDWKIAFFHHPLYSSGETHGSADLQRGLLEPIFLKHGVNVVISGHEHFYERLKPQKGIAYFTIGSSAKLRKGDLRKSELTLYGNDAEYMFMLVEIVGDEMYFQAINDKGKTIDTGSVRRVGKVEPTQNVTAQPVVPQAKPSPSQPGPKQPAATGTGGKK